MYVLLIKVQCCMEENLKCLKVVLRGIKHFISADSRMFFTHPFFTHLHVLPWDLFIWRKVVPNKRVTRHFSEHFCEKKVDCFAGPKG